MNTILDDFKNAFRRGDNGVVQLILINLIVYLTINFVWVVSVVTEHDDAFNLALLRQLALPAPLLAFFYKPWTLLTYFVTHEGFWHILWNMLFLYWFGNLIKEYLGNQRFINLYVLGGLAGGVLYLVIFNVFPYFVGRQPGLGLIGASASVQAVMVAAATLIPNHTFNLLLIGPVRIVYIAAFYVVASFFGIAGTNAGGNLAHLGGALIGFLFIRQLQAGRDLGRPLTRATEALQRLFQRKPHLRVTHTGTPRATPRRRPAGPARPDQAEIDAILDKISKSGYDSLTKEEKQKLFSASQ